MNLATLSPQQTLRQVDWKYDMSRLLLDNPRNNLRATGWYFRTKRLGHLSPAATLDPVTPAQNRQPPAGLPVTSFPEVRPYVPSKQSRILDRTRPADLLAFRADPDAQPVRGGNVRLTGLPVGVYVLVNGTLFGGPRSRSELVVPEGFIAVISHSGKLLAYGKLTTGAWRLLDHAMVQPLEEWALEGPDGVYLFELNRASQAPGEHITIERLKHSSWVHVAGKWYQADDAGRVQAGPLQPGAYGVIVTDRDGDAYAFFEQAVPGDRLLGAYNYATGFGYHGWYSGKGFEVKRAFIEAVDEITFSDTPSINRVRQILVNDVFASTDSNRGRKGPARQLDAFLFEDIPALNPVKQTVRDYFTTMDRAWKHLTPFGQDTVLVDDRASYYNTRIRVYEFITVTDRNNRPASWMTLDVLRLDDLPTLARTKQTVYDFVSLEDKGRTSYRHFRKGDTFLFQDLPTRKNLSKFGLDVFNLLDYKVQTLLALFAEDAFNLTDTATGRPMSLRVRDSFLLYERLPTLQNAAVRVSDALNLLDRHAGAFPFRSRVLDELQATEHSILGVQAGRLPIVPDPTITVKNWNRKALDVLQMLEDIIPELAPPETDAPQLVERIMMERHTRRGHALDVTDRSMLPRHLCAQDTFTLSESSEFPKAVTFSPSGLHQTKLAPYQYRPELRQTKGPDGRMHVAYLRSGGGLYHAVSNTDGTWTGVTAQLVTNTPANVRSVGVAVQGDDVYVCYAQTGPGYTLFRVLLGGTVMWERSTVVADMDIQIASTSRYDRVNAELLFAYTTNQRTMVIHSHPTNNRTVTTTRTETYEQNVRLDQVAVAHGTVTWVLGLPDIPGRRSMFTTNPNIRLSREDRAQVTARPRSVRMVPVSVNATVQASLTLSVRPRKLSWETSQNFLFGQDTLQVGNTPLGLKLVANFERLTVREHINTELAVRGLRNPTTVRRERSDDQLAPADRLRSVRLQPTAVKPDSSDQLYTYIHITGGRYERK